MSNDKQTVDTAHVSKKRRKLLKASAAAPLVATLTSGVAQANTSAFQCMNKETNPQPPIDGNKFRQSEDSAVRFKAIRYKKRGEKTVFKIGDKYYYYGGRDVTDRVASGDINLDNFNAKEGYVLDVYEPNDSLTSARRLGPWPEVQFDSAANQPLFQSCWTSVPITAGINKIKGNIV